MFKKLVGKLHKKSLEYPKNEKVDLHVSSQIEKNIKFFKALYSIPKNVDVKLRTLQIAERRKAAILFISSISDMKMIWEHVIQQLINNKTATDKIEDVLSVGSVKRSEKYEDILTEVNRGNTALFIDGEPTCYIIDAAEFQGRGVEKAENEIVLMGPKEAFTEKAIVNISLIRKKIRNENLVIEPTVISKRSRNELYIVYLKNITDEKLVTTIKNKVKKIDVDAVQNLPLLEQYLDERPLSLFPTILYTERPDRAASFLEEGHVVLLMENSPSSLVLPATFWSFFHSAEDHYLRFFNGNFTRILRGLALFITLFTSAIYISVTNYHAEMIPPDLLLAISATREKVPFPAFFEVILMEIAFELIREAGLRVPSPIGPTIGIVGALILGQAAVQANIVSPIVVIVVALGGLSSFAVGDISLNFAIRLIRFLFILSAIFFGIYGMTALFTFGLFYIVSIQSLGVPYLAPLTPKYKSSNDILFRRLLKKEIFRPGYLNTKDHQKKSGE